MTGRRQAGAARPPAPAADNAWAAPHVTLLAASFAALTGRRLWPGPETGAALGRALYDADFALLSHGIEEEPLFNYANRCALALFELDWERCVRTPSRASAGSADQATRKRFMAAVRAQGYASDYCGVRVSSSGRRFRIEGATVWNVIDAAGTYHGQAATFARWADL